MFDVHGDDIILENVKVGELTGGWPTLRDRAIDYLEGTFEGYVSEADHTAQIEEASDKAYKDGEADQKLRGIIEIDAAAKSGFSQGKIAGIKEGWNSALKESARAADTERVALLLASCNKVYALLAQGLGKNKPKIKITEARDTMRACLLELQEAARVYRS